MNRTLLAGALLASLMAIPACKRNAEPAPAEPVSPATNEASADAMAPGVDVVSEAAHMPVSPEAAASFDVKGYAGMFSGKDVQLKVGADGTFKLDQGASHVSGTWTLEKDGQHLLFDPDSKAEQDLLYKMIGNDELQLEGGDSQSLHRNKG